MHELSLVAAIADHALHALRGAGATQVVAVDLSLGVLSCANRASLEFCFPLAVRGTALEGAELRIRSAPLVLACGACGRQSERMDPVLRCPHCDDAGVDVISGADLTIDSLEVR